MYNRVGSLYTHSIPSHFVRSSLDLQCKIPSCRLLNLNTINIILSEWMKNISKNLKGSLKWSGIHDTDT